MNALAEFTQEQLVQEIQNRLIIQNKNLALAILKTVAEVWNIPTNEIRFNPTRSAKFCRPRQAAIVLMHNQGMVDLHIAKFFHLNHGSIRHSIITHPSRLTNPSYFQLFQKAASAL